jgi:hypothetical protein
MLETLLRKREQLSFLNGNSGLGKKKPVRWGTGWVWWS